LDLKAVIHLGRFRQIVLTLFKYGFDDLVKRLDLPGKVFIEKMHPVDLSLSSWERARLAIEELGPTFIKMGQILSQRPDLAPPPLVREFRKLQEQVTPVDFPSVRKVVEGSLHCRLEDVFARFDESPRAAASLAQVHEAVLRASGQVVAVKVQRPGIGQLIDTDIGILEAIARRLDERMESAKVYDFPGLVRELKRSLQRELNFNREARNMKIFQSHFEGSDEVYVPKVYDLYTTEQVLTMELVEGTKLQEFMNRPLEEREILAKRGVRLTIKQVLEDGFFHADPHPGNVVILDNLVYCLLDFGMMGRLSQEARFDLIDMIKGMVDKDSDRMLDAILNFSKTDGGIGAMSERILQREVMDIIDAYHSVSIGELNIGQLLMEVTSMLRENGLQIPSDLALMIKTLVTSEATARQLYPDLNLIEEAEPYVRRLAKERWSPASLWQSLRRNLFFLFELQRQFPQKVNHIIDLIDRGELNIRFQHENLGGLLKTLETITNRMVSAIIISAIVVASSLMIVTNISGLLVLGIIGYLVSGVLGLWLVFNILFARKF
jgi:ubiquinone biosynthesis protein